MRGEGRAHPSLIGKRLPNVSAEIRARLVSRAVRRAGIPVHQDPPCWRIALPALARIVGRTHLVSQWPMASIARIQARSWVPMSMRPVASHSAR